MAMPNQTYCLLTQIQQSTEKTNSIARKRGKRPYKQYSPFIAFSIFKPNKPCTNSTNEVKMEKPQRLRAFAAVQILYNRRANFKNSTNDFSICSIVQPAVQTFLTKVGGL
jgi:hypothetical protein